MERLVKDCDGQKYIHSFKDQGDMGSAGTMLGNNFC